MEVIFFCAYIIYVCRPSIMCVGLQCAPIVNQYASFRAAYGSVFLLNLVSARRNYVVEKGEFVVRII
jgi:hypothetical protein